VTRLVQLEHRGLRRVALVDEPRLRLLSGGESIHALAGAAIAACTSLTAFVSGHLTSDSLEYDAVYAGRSDWRLLAPIDHPAEPARCLVSGTGLTHLGSASNRDAMHGTNDADLTDSMRMFRAGLEGGRPEPGTIGIPPEWFYKGSGHILRAHGEPLIAPPYADDGGEEAEIAGVYLIDPAGQPRRLGMSIGNEFSDHKFEKRNYLYLAGSKVRNCSLGPELVVDPAFDVVSGRVTIERAGQAVWSKEIATGEGVMCHSVANIEHHHFKFEAHRRPGDVHVHYFGAASLSFGDGVELADGDDMLIEFAGFGRALRNRLSVAHPLRTPVEVQGLG
jgi:hypothetical protein